jgi:hypothetical protein
MTTNHGFAKSEGLTPSERNLARLCERSFLRLWSYPNVYRQPGKELCDVLVVFREHIIIFSDKSCQFPNTGDVARDWARWFKRAVQQSAQQVYGAERWLRQQPGRLFLDAKCDQQFPFALPPASDARFHRVVVALNTSDRCKDFFGDASGSMVIRTDIVGDVHREHPFTIGQIDPDRGYVHVFDDVTLDIVLRELDTISDFTDYLTRKEAVVRSGRMFAAAGEHEVLAHYLTELNEDGKHDIVLPPGPEGVWFEQGAWAAMSSNLRYGAKKSADRASYAWDELIEKFTTHMTAGTLSVGRDRPLSDHERAVRMMAGEDRLTRRSLVAALFNLLTITPDGRSAARFVWYQQAPDRAYQFLICPQKPDEPYDQYRERR